ncbi:glycosyltransferase [Yeosuana marina]|uniref:glycosyltransferase n=1 Tax=Yeosuana marina TaxID=1565536 RepID=UPI001421C00E|nr:glycosyltransferase [Yeosuana marina]
MRNKKIALVGFRLSTGGSEKVIANLSNFFHKKGIEVHIIIFHDEVGYEHSGTVFNLGKLKSEANTIFNKLKRFYYLNKYIKKHQFDFIIDFRFRINLIQELLISKCIYKGKTIYTVHSSKIDVYMPKQVFLTKLIYGKCYKIIAINDRMKNLIEERHQLNNVIKICNPLDVERIKTMKLEEIDLDFEFVLGAGQFSTNEKQFDKLIYAYSKSILPKKRIALVVLGEGVKKGELINKAQSYGVGPLVHFLGFKENPYKYFSKAKFFIMSSLYEGLPMVLIESLSCGTPVVAFDCPTGPKEVIQHKINGLLIEDQNIDELVKGINIMVTDQELYHICKVNSERSVEKFSLKVIGKQWLELMNYN